MLNTYDLNDLCNRKTDFSFIEPPERQAVGDCLEDDGSYSDNLWLSFSYDSDDLNFDAAISHLMQQHEFQGNKRSIQKCLKCILINVRRLLKSGKSSMLYRRGHGYYSDICENKLINPLCITKTLLPVIDVLIEEGYLHGVMGTYVLPKYTNYGQSSCSLISPLEKMERLVADYDLTSAKIKESSNAPLIVVRIKSKKKNGKKKNKSGKKGKDIFYYPRGKTVSEMKRRLSTVNALLSRTDIRLAPGSQNISLDGCALHRIFNDCNLETGGRFYGGSWQQLPSGARSKILINGETTVELDYAGQHIGMLYAVLGGEIPDFLRKDPYGCMEKSRFPRGLIKKAVLTAINSKDLTSAWRGTLYKLRPKRHAKESVDELKQKARFRELIKTKKDYEELIEEFLTVQPLLREGLYKGWGSKLQRLDSNIADYILYTLALDGIAALCVHDSFIVQERYKDELLAVMKSAYLESPIPVLQKAFTSIKDREKTVYSFKNL